MSTDINLKNINYDDWGKALAALNLEELDWMLWLLRNDPEAEMERDDDRFMWLECDIRQPFAGLDEAARKAKLNELIAAHPATKAMLEQEQKYQNG